MQELETILPNILPNMPIAIDEIDIIEPIEQQEIQEDFLNITNNEESFYNNLVELVEDNVLSRLGAECLSGIEADKVSRGDWDKISDEAFDFLITGLHERKDEPFKGAYGIRDTSLLVDVLNAYKEIKPCLFPKEGPFDFKIQGAVTPDKEEKVKKIALLLNNFLFDDPLYNNEVINLIINVVFYGSCFRKVSIDPVKNIPVVRTISAKDLYVHNNCKTIHDAPRITQKITLSRKDFALRVDRNFYRNVKLSLLDMVQADDSDDSDLDSLSLGSLKNNVVIYEHYTNLLDRDLYGDFVNIDEKMTVSDIPKPYFISLLSNGTILSIYRDWEYENAYFDRKKTFVHYKYLPFFDFYGIGIAHKDGPNASSKTDIRNLFMNNAVLSMSPRGLMDHSVIIKNKKAYIGPAEFVAVEHMTNGGFENSFKIFDTPQVSPMLWELYKTLESDGSRLATAIDASDSQAISSDTAVGTAEIQQRNMESKVDVILDGLHSSLTEELSIFFNIVKSGLSTGVYVSGEGKEYFVTPEDLNVNGISVVPTSEKTLSAQRDREKKTKLVFNCLSAFPNLMNGREAVLRLLKDGDFDEQDAIKLVIDDPKSGPPAIDPNKILEEEVKGKHEIEMLKTQQKIIEDQARYVIDSKKVELEYIKNNIPAPDLPQMPVPQPQPQPQPQQPQPQGPTFKGNI